jgi:cholesterol oxidase
VFVDSNVVTYNTLAGLNPNHRNELHICKGYGHQDTFQGKDCDKDIFPVLVDFIERQRHPKLQAAAPAG